MMKTSPPLAVVKSINQRPHRWQGNPPVAACIASARRGEFWRYLDVQLLHFITTRIHGAPLGQSENTSDGEVGVRLAAVTHMVTGATQIDGLWEAKTGRTVRSYAADRTWDAETYGMLITDQIFHWVGAWISCVVGSCRQADAAHIRECVFETLQLASASEWDWERSRRAMTYRQLKLAAGGPRNGT